MASTNELLHAASPVSIALLRAQARRSSWARLARIVVLVLLDVSAIAIASVMAYVIWAGSVLGQPSSMYIELAPLGALLPIGYATAGLYPGFGLSAVEVLRRLTAVTSLLFVTSASLVFILKVPDLYSRMTFGLLWSGTVLLVPLTRLVMLPIFHRVSWWSEPCLVVTTRSGGNRIRGLLAGMVRVGYRAIAFAEVELPSAEKATADHVDGVLTRIVELIDTQRVRVTILDSTVAPALLRGLQPYCRHVIALRGFADIDMAEPRDLGGIFGLEYRNELLRRRNQVAKRGLDLVLGGAALLLALPLIAAAVLAMKLVSPGPGLFRQVRFGRDGQPFTLLKIRTMVANADTALPTVLSDEPGRRGEWEDGFKLSRDPRVVPVLGHFLRRFSIDELPQLWNVIAGEMSLVGPRPLPDYHLQAFDAAQQTIRQSVAPGMTGLWQVRSWGSGSAATQHAHDEYYVRNWSIWLDLFVLGKTMATVLRGRSHGPTMRDEIRGEG